MRARELLGVLLRFEFSQSQRFPEALSFPEKLASQGCSLVLEQQSSGFVLG